MFQDVFSTIKIYLTSSDYHEIYINYREILPATQTGN